MKIVLDARFTKNGLMRYISHLDLIRLFSRSIRRAELPVKVSEGFNPKYVFSIKNALKLGIESESEDICFTLARPMNAHRFCDRLQLELPEGIEIRSKEVEK